MDRNHHTSRRKTPETLSGADRVSPVQKLTEQQTSTLDFDEIETNIALREVPREVTTAPIEVYADDVLAARLNHYEREALLERNPGIRAAMKGEATRTKNEITRRRAGLVAAAERVFK